MNVPRGALVGAWVTAMVWVGYRDIKAGQVPQPRTIIRGSLLYGLLGLAAPLITDQVAAVLGWGVLAATILQDLQTGQTAPDSGSGTATGGRATPR